MKIELPDDRDLLTRLMRAARTADRIAIRNSRYDDCYKRRKRPSTVWRGRALRARQVAEAINRLIDASQLAASAAKSETHLLCGCGLETRTRCRAIGCPGELPTD